MGLKVLLVDDSAVMRKMVARALRQAGLEIDDAREAGNGIEGLGQLTADAVDIILCDWNMPEMNGIDFVREVRKTSKTPIVMLTTESSTEKVTEAMTAGADGFITKPFTPEKLEQKIRLVLDE